MSAIGRRLTVMLDDGRSVAFDTKDYAHLDHGYAATIHKAQGVTVDRVHVLATPGLDAHASYVALSRHRDRVDLHYGQDDFADQSKLVRTLGRERGKDMVSDYAIAPDRNAGVGPNTVRTQMPMQEPADPASQSPKRDIFAGLRLKATPIIVQPERSPLDKAVERYARAAADIIRMEELAGAMLAAVAMTDAATKEGWRKGGAAFFRRTGPHPRSSSGNKPGSAATRDSGAQPAAADPGAA